MITAPPSRQPILWLAIRAGEAAANPDQLQRPVVETVWFEIVLPSLKTGGGVR